MAVEDPSSGNGNCCSQFDNRPCQWALITGYSSYSTPAAEVYIISRFFLSLAMPTSFAYKPSSPWKEGRSKTQTLHNWGHWYLPEHREERRDLLVSYISVHFTLLRQHMYSFPEPTRRPEWEKSEWNTPVSVQKEQAARALLGVSVGEDDRSHITERYVAACTSAQSTNIPSSDRAAILNKYMDAYMTLKKAFERQWPHKLEILRTSRKRRILDILKMMFTFEDDSFLYPKKYTPAQERLIDTLKVDLDGVSDGKDD